MSPASAPKGSYLLLLHLREEVELDVGAPGTCTFPRGTYVYAGSAQSSLFARVGRHFSTEKKVHWHIDRLLLHAEPVSAIMIEGDDRECEINRLVAGMEGSRMVCKGFGSSDCECPTHLHLIVEDMLPTIINEMRWLDGS